MRINLNDFLDEHEGAFNFYLLFNQRNSRIHTDAYSKFHTLNLPALIFCQEIAFLNYQL